MTPQRKKNNNESLRAAALRYQALEDTAPRLIAKGHNLVAEQILEIARAHNIPIQQNPDLLEILFRLEIQQTIPEDLYVAVAEILAYVYRIKQGEEQSTGAITTGLL